jgi:AAA family ATP:ADP antiporter
LFVETIGSILVTFFWSFASDITAPESAKRGYPLVILGAQFGTVFFPLMGGQIIKHSSSGVAVACGAGAFLLIPLMVYYFMHTVSSDQMQGFKGAEDALEGKPLKSTFYEGLQLIATRPYLLAIFTVVTLYEVVTTIFDFQLKGLARETVGGGDVLAAFMMNYAVWVNLMALLCAILGAGKLTHRLGLKKTLLCMPILVACAALGIAYMPYLSVVFWIMVVLKGINYSLNQPAKEQLYIPTSKDSKYKAKSWIDAFGSRSSKGLGGSLHDLLKSMGPDVFVLGTLTISFGLIGIWIYAARFLGKTHAEAIKENRIVC